MALSLRSGHALADGEPMTELRDMGLIGVLGGMGPAATIDFMTKVRALTPAQRDQEHVPLLVHCVPQIPDRVSAILTGGDAPFLPLLAGARLLEAGGARAIAIACNTAHHWHARLAAEVDIPVLHIAHAVRDLISGQSVGYQRLALMGTVGIRAARLYDNMLAPEMGELLFPDVPAQTAIDRAIGCVKAGELASARQYAAEAVDRLRDGQQADRLLLACTELPIALRDSAFSDVCIDATHALAQACVRFSLGLSVSTNTKGVIA